MGENTGITTAAPRWLHRTISALEAEEVEVNMTKLDAMEQVSPRHSCSQFLALTVWVCAVGKLELPQNVVCLCSSSSLIWFRSTLRVS